MTKVHNFSAGPSILPQAVFKQASKAIIDFENTGLSILEVSHRSKEIVEVINEAENLVKELYNLPSNYRVLFLTGGASSQFFMSAMNFLHADGKAAYVDTGTWSTKAIKEAKIFGQVDVVASSADQNYTYIPQTPEITTDYDYLHLTSNNTIYGTQYATFPSYNGNIICDMSSDIFSREIDINKFSLIYAGAQKNMGPAGVTMVIVNEDKLKETGRQLPTMLDYKTHIKKHSAFNTPPVFPIYVSMLVLRWLKENGGISEIEKLNAIKAKTLYNEIDQNDFFYSTVKGNDRSQMNVTFKLHDESLENSFLEHCEDNQISGIKGHRSVGGFRASIYNAMPLESVEFLTEIMQSFSRSI